MDTLLPLQKKTLEIFRKSPLKKKFYWTGGTLLAFLYLNHRLSHDLDFFTDKSFSYDEIISFIRILKQKLNLKKIEAKKIHNRYEFFIHNKGEMRIEFVLFEHPNIKKRRRYKNILCDSLSDAAANKVMAFFDRNDPKDLFDLYFLLKKYKLKELLELVEKKFGVLFPQSAFWSEIYKALKDLKTLKPFLLAENKIEKERLIKKIKDYFINRSTKYLHRLLS